MRTFLYLLSLWVTSYLFSAEYQIQDCVFYQLLLHDKQNGEVHFYKHVNSKAESSFIKTIKISGYDHVAIQNSCKTYLDLDLNNKTKLILPDHLEIIRGKKGYLTVHFYKEGNLIANDVTLLTYNPSTIDQLMDVKKLSHPLTKRFRPTTLLDKVQKVTYHNGFYTEKALHYANEYNNGYTYIACVTWQHNLVRIIKYSLMGIVLCYITYKCGIKNLLYKYI